MLSRAVQDARALIAFPKPDQLFINSISLFSGTYETHLFDREGNTSELT